MAISIRQVHDKFVGEVSGVDASSPLDPEAIRTIEDGINATRYSSSTIRRSTTRNFSTSAELSARLRRRATIAPDTLQHAEIADISNLNVKNELRARDDHRRLDSLGNQLWHSDASFRPVSGALSMLHARGAAEGRQHPVCRSARGLRRTRRRN